MVSGRLRVLDVAHDGDVQQAAARGVHALVQIERTELGGYA
jgi:hypothetical protein